MLLIGRDSGFTLLEILIVLVLITLLLTVNIPNFSRFLESIEVRGKLREVEHFFAGVRESSILSSQEVIVCVSESGLKIIEGNSNMVDCNFKIRNYTTDKIIYYPDGTSSGGNFSFNILDSQDYEGIVDSITGKLEWTNFQ